jgi:hypothetical protein
MRTKSVVLEAREIQLAIELIELGARLQLLEAETSLSRDRLIKLYKELKGASPPKGMLPFSTDWFVTWLPNMTPCTRCGGHFVTHAHEPHGQYVCGLCAPPSRAGKTRKAKHAHAADLAPADAVAPAALPGPDGTDISPLAA